MSASVDTRITPQWAVYKGEDETHGTLWTCFIAPENSQAEDPPSVVALSVREDGKARVSYRCQSEFDDELGLDLRPDGQGYYGDDSFSRFNLDGIMLILTYLRDKHPGGPKWLGDETTSALMLLDGLHAARTDLKSCQPKSYFEEVTDKSFNFATDSIADVVIQLRGHYTDTEAESNAPSTESLQMLSELVRPAGLAPQETIIMAGNTSCPGLLLILGRLRFPKRAKANGQETLGAPRTFGSVVSLYNPGSFPSPGREAGRLPLGWAELKDASSVPKQLPCGLRIPYFRESVQRRALAQSCLNSFVSPQSSLSEWQTRL